MANNHRHGDGFFIAASPPLQSRACCVAFGRKHMKTYIEVSIVSRYEDQNELINALRAFCNDAEGWQYLEEQSKKYASATGEPSCAILRLGDTSVPAVAVTNKAGKTFYIANIVPKESGRMTMEEYNQVASDFSRDLRKYAKNHGFKLTVRSTSEIISLREIISGKKCRELFERYLNLYPTSYHFLDIERLDTFICYLSRHSRKRIDLELLKGWLREEKGWSEKDAAWCVDRIDVGLSILKVNRKHC